MLDDAARSVASILGVEVQLLVVLKGEAGGHLGESDHAIFWPPGSKRGEVEGILQHSGKTQRGRLKGRRPRWCRHYCRCLRDIHPVPSHLGGIFFQLSFQLPGCRITCDVKEAGGSVQLCSTDPELCNVSHQIAPVLCLQIPIPGLTPWHCCFPRRQKYLLSQQGIDEWHS